MEREMKSIFEQLLSFYERSEIIRTLCLRILQLRYGYWEDCVNEYDCEELVRGTRQIRNKYA
ncbi:hypothetical protein RRV45_19685 [Bacillus sp. DTU_2020_1000418_1_SI_GHA_SEK_038]|uniref:hypothetical protein n=1 Tax=Bacillus sp. DTU_2020_1000418_1_SI_GHA_SEK_038 TaxID=3077585 RepID=UPI0028EB4716|nr:hypothetical protein [Bacillus sp. DTU_2020_1000418_1_SI_GHA_SEK_038]WNS75075.1 hypothetical protein RRV45_19685 [Bacillus sp. DTU_2020_1000418_1_SI_GHA_SEK_038]